MKIICLAAAVSVGLLLPAAADHHEKGGRGAAPYRHVVCFKFKGDATAGQVAEIEKAFAALAGKIDTIEDFEWGTNVSPEGLADGFTHCFIVTFADKDGLEVYLPHPAHKAFVAKLRPILEKAFVIDFVAGG